MTKFNSAHGAMKTIFRLNLTALAVTTYKRTLIRLQKADNLRILKPLCRIWNLGRRVLKTHAKRHVNRTAFQCLVAEVRFLWSDLSSSPPVFRYIGVCFACVILHRSSADLNDHLASGCGGGREKTSTRWKCCTITHAPLPLSPDTHSNTDVS
jgi:hypothetical protein